MSGAPPANIVVLGGGTAGWMAACLMAHRWGPRGTRVTVIESPDIGIIGVGEGSTPQLKLFFDTLGIAEADWMPACDATYKTGIGFRGWSDAAGFDAYFHPFPTELDVHTYPDLAAAARHRRRGGDAVAHPDPYFLCTRLAAERRAPLAPHFPFRIGYGYHFDAYKVGAFLRDHATRRLGVVHRQARIVEVAVADGAVRHLLADDGTAICADLYVDASGFRGLIHQQGLGVAFLSFADNLFNDRAVVMPTPLPAGSPSPRTLATALSAGWAWEIPLTSRVGNGYVHSSRHIAPEDAEAELRAHLGVGNEIEARHLSMRVGRVADSWAGNSLAVGLAQGFLEPLEATALHIVQSTVEGFVQAFEDGGFTDRHRAVFNATIARRYEGVRDYIVCHYKVNQRRDTAYWRENAANEALSASLRGVLHAWFTGDDLEAEIARQDIARYYAPLSWTCLLAGYGTYPDRERLRERPAPATLRPVADVEAFVAGCAVNFPTCEDAMRAM